MQRSCAASPPTFQSLLMPFYGDAFFFWLLVHISYSVRRLHTCICLCVHVLSPFHTVFINFDSSQFPISVYSSAAPIFLPQFGIRRLHFCRIHRYSLLILILLLIFSFSRNTQRACFLITITSSLCGALMIACYNVWNSVVLIRILRLFRPHDVSQCFFTSSINVWVSI